VEEDAVVLGVELSVDRVGKGKMSVNFCGLIGRIWGLEARGGDGNFPCDGGEG